MAYTTASVGNNSVYKNIVEKITGDRHANLKRRCIVWGTTGAPTQAAPLGTLCWNAVDGDAYICTVISGTWVKLNA
jgi:hypothetical protein